MSTIALAPRTAARRRALALLDAHGTDILLGVVVAAFAIQLLLRLGRDFSVDSWLALVAGRGVWQHGIPHHDTLTAASLHHRWIDQQWLSQLASYALYRAGGLALLGVVNVGLLVGPLAAAIVWARRRGATFAAVLVSIAACALLIGPWRQIRTQELMLPLFLACAWLLCADARRPSRRVFWVIPLLALWANLHGTVTLGAVLVELHVAASIWQRRREPRDWARPAALGLGALGAVLVTPYGLQIVGYYHATLGSGTLRRFVSEWQPVTSSPAATAALAIVVALALWSFWRAPRATSAFEKLALLLLCAGCAQVVRNGLFVGLFGLMVLPVSLSAARPRHGSAARAAGAARSGELPTGLRAAINGGVGAIAAACLLAALGFALTRSDASIAFARQSPGMVAAVQRATAADPSLRLLADDHVADFLLWRDPALAGRVVFDVRFELLAADRLERIERVFAHRGPDWAAGARGDRLIVLDRAAHGAAAAAFAREPGSHVLFSDRAQQVVLRR